MDDVEWRRRMLEGIAGFGEFQLADGIADATGKPNRAAFIDYPE